MVQPIETVLSARGLIKTFGHVEALRGADFDVRPGEVVALLGDNGAGKSTLVKTLAGVHRPDGGTIYVDGTPVEFGDTRDARAAGIEVVYQDLALAPHLNPSENVYLGREIFRPGILGKLGVLDKSAMAKEAQRGFAQLGVKIRDHRAPVRSMSGGQQQGVAVCRAAMWAKKILFMDEPTAALGVVQTKEVLDLVRRVRDTGVAVVYICHNIPEVMEIADSIEVLYLGKRIASLKAPDTSMAEIVSAMTGAYEGGQK
ncbi:ATP-binding cassette domain-containing protein [Acrocarpospora catenulata]|uniref:ATP-binding cassette domain-containing protein n=1 Tax=Acrocarpospora catenulata TaxID=2836182 RepID=UPI001BD9B69C|nr:ATP-binding cassette domain-containing protein [Acrocarpospora catenulata]